MKKQLKPIACALLFGAFVQAAPALAGQVTVSNYPLWLLSKAVTQGQADAQILLKAGDVGHHGSLSPSSVKALHDSRFVVWFGDALEQNLVNHLENAPNAISLFKFKAFVRHPMRDVDGRAQAGSFDPHIWLEPTNAKAIVAALTVIHSHANPEYRDAYHANAKAFYQKMDALKMQYQGVTTKPYWAYHDAYQYLERALNLSFAGALTPDHHLSPKASRFRTLNEMRPQPVMCLASQINVSDGIRAKLGDIRTVVRQEDMSDDDDFLAAWQALATEMQACSVG